MISDFVGRLELLVCDTKAKSMVSVHIQFNSSGGSGTVSTSGSWVSPVVWSGVDGSAAFIDVCRMDNRLRFALTAEDSRSVLLTQLKPNKRQRLAGSKAGSPLFPVDYSLTQIASVGNSDVLYRPVCLLWKDASEVYVTDFGPDPDTDSRTAAKPGVKIVSFADGGGVDVLTEECGIPFGIGQSTSNGIVVSDIKTDRLLAIDEKDSQVKVLAGAGERKTVDGPALSSHFNQPKGIAVHGNTAFVACGDTLRLFTPLGEQAKFMTNALRLARLHGILDPRERRDAEKRQHARGLLWSEYEKELKAIVADKEDWYAERRRDLGLKSKDANMKGPEGVLPHSALKAWQRNLRSVQAISKYFLDAGCEDYLPHLRSSQLNDMPVETIYGDQALTAYDRKEDAKSYTANRDRNRFEKLKAATGLHFAYVTNARPFYFASRMRLDMTEAELRSLILKQIRVRGRKELSDIAPSTAMKGIAHVLRKQPEQRLRDIYKRGPTYRMFVSAVDPLPEGDPDTKDYLLEKGSSFCLR